MDVRHKPRLVAVCVDLTPHETVPSAQIDASDHVERARFWADRKEVISVATLCNMG